jgi:Zn-dependent peptidase ImmA (M78 family)/DNA-binding XRE family transcriptional regulator
MLDFRPMMSNSEGEARDARRLFDGNRLRLARELRGYSRQELGRRIDVSGAAISQFELGDARPTTKTLAELATALEFPVRFLGKDSREDGLGFPAFFRSLRSTSVKDRRRARAFVELVRQFALGLARHLDFPERDIPSLPASASDGREDVETIAGDVRRAWSLPSNEPIKNMVALVERHGVIAARVSFETAKLDAFSVPYDDFPVLILCSDKGKRDRSRFDVAHELGHLVMHGPERAATKETERQADQFAAAFLMPAEEIRDELPSKADWNHLLALKKKWGTSIASLLYRARALGKMHEDDYVRATKAMSARRWRVDEPGDLGAPESPVALRKAVDLLAEDGFTLDDIARDTDVPLDQVRRILEAAAPTRPQVVV